MERLAYKLPYQGRKINEAQIVDVSQAVGFFEEHFNPPVGRHQRPLKIIISSVLSFYEKIQAAGLVDQDGDMLLFQYGIYDGGLGPFFEIVLTRQFTEVERNDDECVMSQFHLKCVLKPTEELYALGQGKRWCHHASELKNFSAWLMHHPVLATAEHSQRIGTEVSWELV